MDDNKKVAGHSNVQTTQIKMQKYFTSNSLTRIIDDAKNQNTQLNGILIQRGKLMV